MLAPGEDRRGLALGISLALHAAAFVAVMEGPAIRLPPRAESEYKQSIAGKEEKLVWYKFRKELPAVTPPRKTADLRTARAETIAKQTIVSSPKDAPKRDRMVWTPAPQIAPAPIPEAPNLLAVRLPDAPRKAFVAPVEVKRPEKAAVQLTDAPVLAAKIDTKVPALGTPLPRRQFVAPPTRVPLVTRPQLATEAPQTAANLPPGAGSPITGLAPRLPGKPFTAPPSGLGAKGDVRSPQLDAPENLNVAMVGLNPSEKATLLPALPSPGSFSAGPRLNPNGSAGDARGNGISVPDLYVAGPKPAGGKQDLLAQAYASPTSSANIRAAMRHGEPMVASAAERAPAERTSTGGAAKVSSAPDPRFNGRDIYLMAIQMPNITSYSGSWLMWYSDRMLQQTGQAPVSPPVPHRKVDPKYTATAVAERIEGRVQLACVIDREGKVSTVELVRGLDDRLNESAKEALSKWEFYPASRAGVPVEVDVLVEIPFRLAPPPPRR